MKRTARVLLPTFVLVVASACAAPRNTLGTRTNVCFRALPTGKAAVHQRGKLVGVRLVSRDTVTRVFHAVDLPAGHDFCLVGFDGAYRSEDVDHPAGNANGRYAVVIVNRRGTNAVQTHLVDHLPVRLRK